MQADSEVELHRSVPLTMAFTLGESLNSIYELFPLYASQEAVSFLVLRFFPRY